VHAQTLVLGAGFGGLELATTLSDALGDDAGVTLIDDGDSFVFGYSKLDVLFGHAEPDDVRLDPSHVREHAVQRAGHAREVEGFDEEARVADLSPAAAAHETSQLLVLRPSTPFRLLLKRAERAEVAMRAHDLLDGLSAKRANQLVLEIRFADVEAEFLHCAARQLDA
jgi:hypothetical protein